MAVKMMLCVVSNHGYQPWQLTENLMTHFANGITYMSMVVYPARGVSDIFLSSFVRL